MGFITLGIHRLYGIHLCELGSVAIFSLDNNVSSYQSDHFIPQIPMGKHVRTNTNEITLQRSFIFHIYFIVLLDHTRQYYALTKTVWCLMFSTSNRVFSSKTKEIQYSVVSQ